MLHSEDNDKKHFYCHLLKPKDHQDLQKSPFFPLLLLYTVNETAEAAFNAQPLNSILEIIR